MLSYIKVKGL